MANEELTRLATLAAQFKEAVESSPLVSDPAIAAKVQSSVTAQEMEQVQDLLGDVMSEAMGLAFGGEPSESFLKKNLQIADLMTEFMLRAVPEKQLAAIIPQDQKTEANSKAFEAAKAPALAKLFVPKP